MIVPEVELGLGQRSAGVLPDGLSRHRCLGTRTRSDGKADIWDSGQVTSFDPWVVYADRR